MLASCTQGLTERSFAHQMSTISVAGDEMNSVKLRYPLVKMNLETYALAVDAIGEDVFTVDQMAVKFKDDFWIGPGHWNKQSDWRSLLNSLPLSKGQLLHKVPVICLGVLWCQANNFYKAQILFELLNPLTKYKQNVVSRDDPEWQLVFMCLFEIAAITLVKQGSNSDFVDVGLRRRAVKAMIISDINWPEEYTGII